VADRLPVTVVTGFLGSGKTTLIGKLLGHPAMGETAVIVNELGEVAIDHHLLRRVDERTVLLANGCVCCSLRGDLADELRDLFSRRTRGEIPAFRRVVVETTGIADPAPIASTLVSEPVVRHHYELETIIATVDAVNGLAQLERDPESVRQVAAADRLLVTKTDLAAEGDAALLESRLRALNPAAEVLEASFGEVEPDQLFGGDGGRVLASRLADEETIHNADIRSFCLVFDEELEWTAFGLWLTMLLQSRGDAVLRVKGLLNVGGPGPIVLNGVQHVVHPPIHLGAWAEEDQRSRIVFIVRGLEGKQVEASLAAFNRAARARAGLIG
jgi:G3E family GTPase